MALEPRDLAQGNAYFMVTYPDASLRSPVVITYEYMGRDIHGSPEAGAGSEFYFKYLPAFRYDDGPSLDDAPVVFTEAQLHGLSTIDGLLEELNEVRQRILRK